MDKTRLAFQIHRKDLYRIIRITAAQRPLRKVAPPGLALLVLLGHAMDGNYMKGAVWAAIVAGLYWGVSQAMFLLHAYGGSNETLLSPQELELHDDRMVVTSEHGTEEFARPVPGNVRSGRDHVLARMGKGTLVFLEGSFAKAEDYRTLKGWLLEGLSGKGEEEKRG